MKRLFFMFVLFSCLSLLGLSLAYADAEVYVIGSPTVFPEYNNKLPVVIRVIDRPTYSHVEVTLEHTSSMNGRCTNFPVNSSDTSDDLRILLSDNPGWTRVDSDTYKYEFPANYSTGSTNLDAPTLYVRCIDYGAWGKVKAELYEKIRDNKFKRRDRHVGTVPRDENGNHIADGWENDFYNPQTLRYGYVYKDRAKGIVDVKATRNSSAIQNYPYSVPLLRRRQSTVDAETGPSSNRENGDGLTVFEEYRGLLLNIENPGTSSERKVHMRPSPRTKNVFYVLHPGGNGERDMRTYGIGNASMHPSHSFTEIHGKRFVNNPFIAVRDIDHELSLSISDETGWINTNSDGIPDTKYVYAVRIRDGGTHPQNASTLGNSPVGKPDNNSVVYIYTERILTVTASKMGIFGISANNIIAATIGHEVGHTINLKHCPIACVNATAGQGCMMRPFSLKIYMHKGKYVTENNIGVSPHSTHYIDYDLVEDVKTPQEEAPASTYQLKIKTGAGNFTGTLISSSGSTGSPGGTHWFDFNASSAYKSVYWYVKGPTDTSANGTNEEIDPGDGSTTSASFSYTFASDAAAGDWTILASVYPYSGDVLEVRYTVSVSASTTTPTTTPTPTLVSSDGVYTATAGDSHTANLTLRVAPSYVFWYIKKPGDSSPVLQRQDTSGSLTSQLSYPFPSGVSGDYVISVSGTSSASDLAAITASYTVSVSLPSSSTTPTATTFSATLEAESGSSLTIPVYTAALLHLKATVPFRKVKWYKRRYWETQESLVDTQNFSPAVSETKYTPFIEDYAGAYEIRAEITSATNLTFSVSCTVTRE